VVPKRLYVMAVVCYLAIPVVVICGVGLFVVIDPGIARGRADYARTYRLGELARLGVLAVTAGLALLLWTSCCYRVLKSRQRLLRWLSLATAGPVGFGVIAALEDRSPAPGDRYQRIIRNLKTHWRVPVEIGVLVAVWVVAHESVVLEHALMVSLESLRTGTPAAMILAQHSASSGMWAAGEGFEVLYLVPLLYLLWPVLFSIAIRPFESRCARRGDIERATRLNPAPSEA
jgi:hypothetical protein